MFSDQGKVKWGHSTDLVCLYLDEDVLVNDRPTEYVGQTNVRLETRVYEHCNTDRSSAVYKHLKAHNKEGSELNFNILDKKFEKEMDRRIAESIYATGRKPYLNRQKRLINWNFSIRSVLYINCIFNCYVLFLRYT